MIRLRDLVRSHFTGREGGMTTVWRPRVRIPVPDIDGADADENRRDESTTKGTKRKRAPQHKGAVRARGEASLEVQGVRCLSARSSAPLSARSAVVHQYASTVVSALNARSAVGQESASTVVYALRARSAVGASICEHGRQRPAVQGVRWVINMRARSSRSSVQGVRWGSESASTVVERSECKECHTAKQ